MEICAAVQQRIRQLCLEEKVTIDELSEHCGVSASMVYSILNGKSKNPGVISIQKICDGLNISIKYFFDSFLFENSSISK